MGLLTGISLFAGAGGLDLAARWSGIRTVCYVEIDRYAQAILMSRIRSGDLDDAPIWDDVATFDGKPWRGKVDIVFGGFPCQDVSVAGKRAGIVEGARSGLWREFARIVGEVGPRFVLVENVPGLLADGQLGVVLGDLAAMGFDAKWGVWGACAMGAPHTRERVWCMAYTKSIARSKTDSPTHSDRDVQRTRMGHIGRMWGEMARFDWEIPTRWVLRSIDGLAFRADRTRCIGNGVVPQQATPAFQIIKELAGMSEGIRRAEGRR